MFSVLGRRTLGVAEPNLEVVPIYRRAVPMLAALRSPLFVRGTFRRGPGVVRHPLAADRRTK